MKTKKKTKAQHQKEARRRADNRPWWDRATDRDFFTPEAGSHTLLITGDPTERTNDYGTQVVDIPTNLGVLSTASFSVLRPLAQLVKKGKRIIGKRLMFRVKGVGQAKRYEEVIIK